MPIVSHCFGSTNPKDNQCQWKRWCNYHGILQRGVCGSLMVMWLKPDAGLDEGKMWIASKIFACCFEIGHPQRCKGAGWKLLTASKKPTMQCPWRECAGLLPALYKRSFWCKRGSFCITMVSPVINRSSMGKFKSTSHIITWQPEPCIGSLPYISMGQSVFFLGVCFETSKTFSKYIFFSYVLVYTKQAKSKGVHDHLRMLESLAN